MRRRLESYPNPMTNARQAGRLSFEVRVRGRRMFSRRQKQNARAIASSGGCRDISLTMSYFHTGTRTIIGAEAFHGPVRDGKEWDHLAMVIRLNWSPGRHMTAKPIHENSNRAYDCFNRRANTLSLTWGQSYRVKPHGQLVSVSLTHYCASTPDLSTSWS